jgi:hypothetical protein
LELKKIILLALIVAAGWQVYTRQAISEQHVTVITNADLELMNTPYFDISKPSETSSNSINLQQPSSSTHQQFSCDGRQHCSQMRSCEEATFFIQSCPNTKMDGDHDGVPCERQWC